MLRPPICSLTLIGTFATGCSSDDAPATGPGSEESSEESGEEAAKGDGELRWILTPHSALEHRFAAVAWEWIYESDCWNGSEVAPFVADHYLQVPENIPMPPGDP